MPKSKSKRLQGLLLKEPDICLLKDEPFVIKPILMLGRRFGEEHSVAIELVWFATSGESHWTASVRPHGRSGWATLTVRGKREVVHPLKKARRLVALIDRVSAGEKFDYRVALNGKVVFEASAVMPPRQYEPYRVAVFGDYNDGEAGAKRMTWAVHRKQPRLVVIAGDIVYNYGRMSEYIDDFFPIYNAEEPNPDRGAPLGRSTLTAAVLGNHDVLIPKFVEDVDAIELDLFAFHRIWRQPRNGPSLKHLDVEEMVKDSKNGPRLLRLFGKHMVQNTSYSFDFGNSHWVVLDANPYVDWQNEKLVAWLENDLMGASNATWKFVSFHQPGFNSDPKYKLDQRMRVLAPIFERHGVDVVFSGHGHFYERSFPLKFRPGQKESVDDWKLVSGEFELDTTFNGKSNTRPNGVIYIVTGAGGQLASEHMRPTRHGVSDFTAKIEDNRRSFTLLDVDGKTLRIRQLTTDNEEIESLKLTKP